MLPFIGQVAPPPFTFGPMTWVAFLLANAIIMAFLGPRLLRDLRGWFTPGPDASRQGPDRQGPPTA